MRSFRLPTRYVGLHTTQQTNLTIEHYLMVQPGSVITHMCNNRPLDLEL